MTITIILSSTFTVTLLLGYFVCVAQGYHNRDYKLFSIIRVNDEQGQRVDQVESKNLRQCMTNRQLSALVYAYGRQHKWTGITNHEIVDLCQKYQNRLIEHEWMSSDRRTAPSDIISMFEDVRKSSSVLRLYLDSVLDQETEKAILFVIETEGNSIQEIDGKMDSYIRPFTDKVIDEYDFAIDYITRQYREHCISNFGIVQKNKLFYLKVWWSSVRRIDPQCCQDDDEMTLWKAFMATACPFPKEKFHSLLDRIGKPTLNLVNFSREIEMPKELESLLPYLPMIKRSTIGGLVDQLVASFKQYKKMSESQRKVHDEDLLVGYQKKFIVLQTIVRMMHKDPSMTERSETVGIAEITAAIGIGSYKSIQSHLTPNPTTPFPNITFSPQSGSMDRGISHQTEPVWLIVGVMIVIVAIVLVCAVLCLIRGKKRKRNDGYKDKTSKTSTSTSRSTSNNRSTI